MSNLRAIALLAGLAALLATSHAEAADTLQWQQWGVVDLSGGKRWRFFGGEDFNQDGRADIVGYRAYPDGLVTVGENSGSWFDFASAWLTVPSSCTSPCNPATDTTYDWTFVAAGDLTGDGRPDLVGYNPGTGQLKLYRHEGNRFVEARVLTIVPGGGAGWVIRAGNFAGDARTDLLAYRATDGSLWVGEQKTVLGVDNFVFGSTSWATISPASNDWTFDVGDFTADGLLDVVAKHAAGTVWVGRNTGSRSFAWLHWVTMDSGEVVAGDFVGDGKPHLVALLAENLGTAASLWGLRNAQGTFFTEAWGGVYAAAKDRKNLLAADFDCVPGATDHTACSKSLTDVFAFDGHDGTLWVARHKGLRPEGYAWPLSARPGQTIDFHVSGPFKSAVRFLRYDLTDSGALKAVPVDPQSGLVIHDSIAIRSLPGRPWEVDQGWARSMTLEIPDSASWPSGIYAAELVGKDNGEVFLVSFVVKPRLDGPVSAVAVVANTNTWNAYNSWGGRSKYSSGHYPGNIPGSRLTFKRPNPKASPLGSDDLVAGEAKLVAWLRREGFSPHVYTDQDFDAGAVTTAKGYTRLVVGTHPEYWTVAMRANLVGFLEAGGSLLYLGGNGIFEVVEYPQPAKDVLELLVGNPDHPDSDERQDALFRMRAGLHEQSVLGIATAGCNIYNQNRGTYRVLAPTHGLMKAAGLNSPVDFAFQASADEVDNTLFGTEVPCGIGVPSVPKPPAPAKIDNLTILARAYGPNGTPQAEMVYYRYRSPAQPGVDRGFVFSVGSILWPAEMVRPDNAAMRNLVRSALTQIF